MKKHLLFLTGGLLVFCLTMAQNSSPEYWSQIAKVLPEPYENSQIGEFGSSIDVFGNYAVVGEQGYLGYKGRAFVLYYNGTTWEKIARLYPSDAEIGTYFGNKVAIDGNTIVVAAFRDKKAGIDAGAIYVFEKPATGWKDTTETAKLFPSGINGYDLFGGSVDISGNVIVAGASGYNAYKGGVFVYEKPALGWANTTKPVASLVTTDQAQWDYLGTSVTISGNTIAVGARGDDDKGAESGSVYVYEKPAGGWKDTTQTAKLTASDGAASDYFGIDVCLSGSTLVVGTSNANAVYVFEKPATVWTNATQTAILTGTDVVNGECFGASVFISENTIIVGAYGDDDTKYNIGSVYIYVKPVSGWTNTSQTAKVQSSTQVQDNNLGYSVCYANDMVLSGAYLSDEINSNTGSVLVFNKPASGWSNATETAKILPETFLSNTNDYFGSSVTLVDSTIAIVGSSGYKKAQGCVYIFQFDGSSWNKILQLTASDAVSYNNFGCSVAVSGNILVVGAEGVGSSAGAVYVYEKTGINWSALTLKAKLRPSVTSSSQYFGRSVAVEDNIIAVGAFGDNSFRGAVFVFEKPALGWVNATENAKLTSSDLALDDYLGYSIGINKNVIVASALQDDNKGSAYVFVKPVTGWATATQTAKLQASDGAANDRFGYRVAISGDVIVVSAFGDDSGKGSVYLFEKPVTGWTDTVQSAQLRASDAAAGDYFGCSVDIDGNNIIVGSQWQSFGMYSSCGSVYFFEKPADTCWINATEKSQLFAKDLSSSDTYGYAVAISGNFAIASASTRDDNGISTGAVYLIERNKPIQFISKPANKYNVCKEGEVKFSFTANNVKKYQWYSSVNGFAYYWIPEGFPYSGTTTNTLTIIPNDSLTGIVYMCKLVNPLYEHSSEDLFFTFDTIAPVINSGSSDREIRADVNNVAVLPDYTTLISITDNCGIESVTQTPSAGTIISGTTQVSISASDELGNISNLGFNVKVKAYDPNSPDGVDDIAANDISVWPNPVSGILTVQNERNDIISVTVLSITGETLIEISPEQSRSTIDFSALDNNLYILMIKTETQIFVTKIIKK